MQQMSEFYKMAPEVQEIVRTALQDVMINRPGQPIKYLARRLRELNDTRRIAELPAAAVERIRVQFDAADTNSSGQIGLDEYMSIRRRTSRMDTAVVSEEEIRRDFSNIDADGCGEISFAEFLGSMLRAGVLASGETVDTGDDIEARTEVSEQEQEHLQPLGNQVDTQDPGLLGAAEQQAELLQPSDELKQGVQVADDRPEKPSN